MVKDASISSTHPNVAQRIKKLFLARETGVFVALIIMAIFLSMATPAFLSVRNLLNVGRQVSLQQVLLA